MQFLFDLVFLLFFHSYPNPSCAIAAPLRARAITVLAKWICARTKVVYTRKGEREGREEREKEGGWGGGEKLQEFCPLSRFNLISTNWGFCSFIVHVSSPTNYTSRFAKISRTQIINRFNESFLYNRRAWNDLRIIGNGCKRETKSERSLSDPYMFKRNWNKKDA